jgi:pantoate--beta-alanine ligase
MEALAPMRTITTVADMQAERESMTGSVGLVPTMGYLHEGHLSLVSRAREEADHVAVSIFVNPTQFGPNEDFERYPRDEKRDLALLQSEGVEIAFVPSVEEMYPPGFDHWVEVDGPLTRRLEGAHRPGHFLGVTTVVARLFHIIRPHRAYFGQKDAQQLRVIRRMVREQGLEVEIVPMPTVREPDGLALSSRNVYLSPAEREAALALPRALALARRLVMEDGVTDAEHVRLTVSQEVCGDAPRRGATAAHLELGYVSVSDEQTLDELETIDRPALILLAARVGATRLIDNTVVVAKGVRIPDDLRELVEADTAALNRTLFN